MIGLSTNSFSPLEKYGATAFKDEGFYDFFAVSAVVK